MSAGQDLAKTQLIGVDRAVAGMDDWNEMYGVIRGMDRPVVAALNGVAAGSTFQVARLCDIRVGDAGSAMGQPEAPTPAPRSSCHPLG